MKNLNIFILFAKYSFKTTFQSSLGVILFTIGKLFRFGMFFAFIYFLLSQTKLLVGYTLEQTILFYLTFNIVDTTSQILFREVYRFRPLVVRGELDTVLIKPYHPFLRVLTGGVDILDIFMLVIYMLLTVFFLQQLPDLSLIHLLSYIGLILNAVLIAASFHILILSFGLLTTEIDNTIMLYRNVTQLGSLPLDVYTSGVRFIFTFIIPIGIMMTVPVKSLFDIVSAPIHLISYGFGIVGIISSILLWNYSLRKYQSWGG